MTDEDKPLPFPLYDRKGNLIQTTGEFARIAEDPNYKRVAETYVFKLFPLPNAHVWISTVWLRGVDHGSFEGTPILFETMLWPKPSERFPEWDNEITGRYATEDEALAGHQEAVRMVRRYFRLPLVAHSARALYALFGACAVGALLGLGLLYWIGAQVIGS